ncbi:hypothetical protein NDU88_000914 [Pleurodeles waltl]|uniref:Uncharacterized protein n=1 Tax=Pleurodeles waltl TaxID=8319 RepID=A0AAV7P2D8_PLEWA|nr:hypothetical protein NDU88_000914 [Pleurodeles waltl]
MTPDPFQNSPSRRRLEKDPEMAGAREVPKNQKKGRCPFNTPSKNGTVPPQHPQFEDTGNASGLGPPSRKGLVKCRRGIEENTAVCSKEVIPKVNEVASSLTSFSEEEEGLCPSVTYILIWTLDWLWVAMVTCGHHGA